MSNFLKPMYNVHSLLLDHLYIIHVLLFIVVENCRKEEKNEPFFYRTKSFMILERTVLSNLEQLFLRSFTKFEQVCHKNHCQYHKQSIFTL